MYMQRMLQNTSWIDENREDYFIGLVLERETPQRAAYDRRQMFTGPDDVRDYLATGQTVNYDDDWYAQIRDGKVAHQQAIKRRIVQQRQDAARVLCDCGHYSAHPMNTSRGTSCPNCYDEMSE